MISIGRIFGQDGKFYDLLEASAKQADTSVHHLVDLLAKIESKSSPDLAAFAQSRREDKRITQELTEQLTKTFITPLDREDIQALAASLYKIPKTVEKFSERLLIADQHVHDVDFSKQMHMLGQAGDTVVLLVAELRKGVNLEKVKLQNDHLQQIEGEADKLMLESLRELYNGDHATIKVIMLKDLYEIMEKVFDRCRDAGNIVFHIVLKHS